MDPSRTLTYNRIVNNSNINNNGLLITDSSHTIYIISVVDYSFVKIQHPNGCRIMFQIDRGQHTTGSNTSLVDYPMDAAENEIVPVPKTAHYLFAVIDKTYSSRPVSYPVGYNKSVKKNGCYELNDVGYGVAYGDGGLTGGEDKNRLYIGFIKITKGSKIKIETGNLLHYWYVYNETITAANYNSDGWISEDETIFIKNDSYFSIDFKKSDDSSINMSEYDAKVYIYPDFELTHISDRLPFVNSFDDEGLLNINNLIHFETRSGGTNWATGVGILEYYYGEQYNNMLSSDPIHFGDHQILIVPKDGISVSIDEFLYRSENNDYIRSYLYPLFQKENVDFKTNFTDARYINCYPERYYRIIITGTNKYLNPEQLSNYVNIYIVDNKIHVPTYYRSYINTKIETINGLQDGFDKFSFAFITDIHIRHNTKHSFALLKKIVNQCAISQILGGGDWNTGYNYESMGKAAVTQDIMELRSLFGDLPVIKTVGNHEWAWGGFDNPYNFSNGEVYNFYYRDNERNATKRQIVYGSENGTYFYQDDVINRVRYISVNVMDYENELANPEHNKMWYFYVSPEQQNWLKTEALNLPGDDWYAVIFSHVAPTYVGHDGNSISNSEELKTIVSNFYAKTDYAANYKGTLLMWLAGHAHNDEHAMISGVNVITIDADCFLQTTGSAARTKGTISEHAFDIFTVDKANRTIYATRIGAGTDRTYTF